MALYNGQGEEIVLGGEDFKNTTPKIEFPNTGISWDGSFASNIDGYGITQMYRLDIASSETDAYTVDYLIKNNGAASTTKKGINAYLDSTFADTRWVSENTASWWELKITDKVVDGIRFAVPLDGLDDSYCFIRETGQVLFAGKNTTYYGVENVLVQQAMTDPTYMTQVVKACTALIAETDGNYDRIPFVAYTDVHEAAEGKNARCIFSVLRAMGAFDKMSKVLQLGDTSGFRSQELINKVVPMTKQINVMGNHDVWDSDVWDNHSTIMKYFPCGDARQFNHNEWWVAIDQKRNVKYIVVNDFEIPETEPYNEWFASTAQIRWLASELAKSDGYDVILCSHVPFGNGTSATKRDGSSYSRGKFFVNTTLNVEFNNLIAARKNKQSGTYTDLDGNTVPYDFTACDSELLISFHGHSHPENYLNMTGGITSYAFECFYDNEGVGKTFYFGYVDRITKKFKNWKLYEGITAPDVQEIDIN